MTATCFHCISSFKRKGAPRDFYTIHCINLSWNVFFSDFSLRSVPPNNGPPWSLSALTQTTCLFYEAQYFHKGCRCISHLYWIHCSLTVFVHSKLWTETFSQDIWYFIKKFKAELICLVLGEFLVLLLLDFFPFFFNFFFLSYYWLVLIFHCFASVTQIILCTCMNTLCMNQNLQKQEDGVRVQETSLSFHKWPSCIFFW